MDGHVDGAGPGLACGGIERLPLGGIERLPRRGIERLPRGGGQLTPSLTMMISRTDRKSTRLNSSHVAISYAVFCLKKKEIIPKREQATRVELSRCQQCCE